MFKKSILNLVLASVSLLGFSIPSDCNEACEETSEILPISSLTKIHENIYLSEEGKIYQEIPCQYSIANDQIQEYISLKGEKAKFFALYIDSKNKLRALIEKLNETEYKKTVAAVQDHDELNILINRVSNIYGYQRTVEREPVSSNTRGSSITIYRDIYSFEWIRQPLIEPEYAIDDLEAIRNNYPKTREIVESILAAHKNGLNFSRQIADIKWQLLTLERKFPGIDKFNSENLNSQATRGSTTPSNIDLYHRREIEISPVYYKKFIELNRELNSSELLSLKLYLLNSISDELSKKYSKNYKLIEKNNSMLRIRVENIKSEVTNSPWENLEITFVPTLASFAQIDIVVSALLFTQHGFSLRLSRKSSDFEFSKDYAALEKYVSQLITELKSKINNTSFKLEE